MILYLFHDEERRRDRDPGTQGAHGVWAPWPARHLD